MGDFLSFLYTAIDTLSLIFFLDAFATRRRVFYCFEFLAHTDSVCLLRARPGHQNWHDYFVVLDEYTSLIQRDFQYNASVSDLYRIPYNLLLVFWTWHVGGFYLWNGWRIFSNKFSTCDSLWRNQLFNRTFSSIYISKNRARKKAFKKIPQSDWFTIMSLFFVSMHIFCCAGAFAIHDNWKSHK